MAKVLACEVTRNIGAPDVDLTKVLNLQNGEPTHDLLGGYAGDAKLDLELPRVKEFGKALAHLPGGEQPLRNAIDPFVRRFVYKIEPASLIPGDAEYIFESEEDLNAGDVIEREHRRLFIEQVEDDDSNREETETSAISRTLHCRLEVDPDAWPGEEELGGGLDLSSRSVTRPHRHDARQG